METPSFLIDIWQGINANMNWMIFALVLSVGYGVRLIPFGKQKWRLTVRILYSTIIVTVAYAIFMKIKPEVWIASYFFTIGIHSALLRLIESAIMKKFPGLRSIGGGGHQKPPDN